MFIEKHLRLEVGNSLVIPEAGDPETECEVAASPVGVGKPRTGHFPSVSASVISKMSPDYVQTWGCAGKLECRVEGGNLTGPATVGWGCFPPLARELLSQPF